MTQAIFLSYASEDSDAARRICEALRAAGLEVWFDQSELRGGDAWDASIRKQIRECALFVPVISPNTNAREEGYFRLEWNLAVERMKLMAETKQFLLPVLLEGITENQALVPDKFRERQWTRLIGEAATGAFVERVGKVLAGSGASGTNAPSGALSNEFGVQRDPAQSVAPAQAGVQVSLPSRGQPNLDPGLRRDDSFENGASGTNFRNLDGTPSIAVLPFANTSRDEDNEYFADGLADELLGVLSKLSGVRVAARSSSFYFKNKQVPLAEVGRLLNVATVLEGSVRKSGNRVRIAVQLVNAAEGRQLWSETFDRTLEDIFAVQDGIAQSVVRELRGTLLAGHAPQSESALQTEIAVATASRSTQPEVQRLCLQARFFLDKRTPAAIGKALALLEQALALDPRNAPAHGEQADALLINAYYGKDANADQGARRKLRGMRRAEAAAAVALALDPQLPRPHQVRSWTAWLGDHDGERSLEELRIAETVAPTNSEVLRTTGYRLMEFGRFDEAQAYFEQAMALDPLSLPMHISYMMLAGYSRDSAQVHARWRVAQEIDPNSWWLHRNMGHMARIQCDYASAIEHEAKSFELLGDTSCAHLIRESFTSGGLSAYLDTVTPELAKRNLAQMVLMNLCAAGQIDAALDAVDSLIESRLQHACYIKVDPVLDPLRDHPRWPALLAKKGFPE